LRLLHLHDHVSIREDLRRVCRDLGPCGDVIRILKASAVARAGIDQDMVSVRHGFARSGRRQAHAEFLWLDFLRAADLHGRSSLSSSAVRMRPFGRDCFDLYRETCEDFENFSDKPRLKWEFVLNNRSSTTWIAPSCAAFSGRAA